MPENILDHTKKTTNKIPFDENEIDIKIHNHRFSLSQEANSCVLESQKSESNKDI